MISMKAERVFSIASIATFFALLPALIYMEIRVLREMPNITYLFVIMDVLLISFMVLEIYLIIRKWRKEKKEGLSENNENNENTEIEKEWDDEETSK